KEWISSFKFPIRVTSDKEIAATFQIEHYLLGSNRKEDFYYYISKKYGVNIKKEEEFLKELPVIPLLQENTTLLLHSEVRGLNVAPNGDVYLKYIIIQ
ncbi:MAG TPA: peptide-binding protein, partial [Fusobacterium sp.]